MSLEFISLYREVINHTLLTPDRLWYLWLLPRLQKEEKIEGAFAELGVYKGGGSKMIYRSVHGAEDMFLFDTFAGIPGDQVKEIDYHTRNVVYDDDLPKGVIQAGAFSCPVDEVANLFRGFENVFLMKGIFPKTAEPVKDIKFSFVHVDMDLYEPTLAALEFFYERMPSGGLFVVDDYGHLNGVTQAVHEFIEDKGLKAVQSAFMQCVIRKPLVKATVKWDPSNILWQFGR